MYKLTIAALLLCLAVARVYSAEKVICYYDSKSYFRKGQGKMQVTDLDPALSFCSHLIYGYAGINKDTNKLVPLNENFDVTKNNYQTVTELKRRYPGLRVMLSVGGGADDQDVEKYMTILESAESRISFVNSAHTLLKAYGFDGLDLAWDFPTNKPKKIRSKLGSIWHKLKKTVVGERKPDEKAEEHREQFVAFAREIKNVFKHDGLQLSLSILPNVNSSIYYDARALNQHLDFVNIMGFDMHTPKRNPKEADFPAPLYELIDRHSQNNINAIVQHWLTSGFPASKINIGIPTFGRAWKMTEDSSISGVPPFTTDGAAEAGPYTEHEGILSYPEICTKINSPVTAKGPDAKLRKVGDPSKRYEWETSGITNRYGSYAFRLPDADGEHGIWVGYDDADTAGNKASYVKAKGLGGIAIYDLSLDDFRGLCTGDKYPILRGAKFRL